MRTGLLQQFLPVSVRHPEAIVSEIIYKICPQAEWRAAERDGAFAGSPIDIADGYIHLSTGGQVAETASRHFSGLTDLVLVAVRSSELGSALKWEPSRGGDLFPHLYGSLPVAHAQWVRPLPLDENGLHVFPGGVAE